MKRLLPIPSSEDAEFVFDPYSVVEKLERYVNLVANGSSGAGVIIGNYGFGKTHVMLYLMNVTRRRYENSLTVYINSPGQSILNIYRAFMSEVVNKGLISRASGRLEPPLSDLVSLLNDGDEAKYARQWLLGDPAPQGFRNKYGLPSVKVSEELAVRFMTDVMRALVEEGFGPVLILLDELEDIITIGPTRRLQYLNLLRLFIDNLSSKALFIASSTPAGWDGVVNTYPPLARRLSSFTVYLKPLDVEETGRFISEVNKRKGINLSLNEEVVKVIHEFTEGNPGEIIKALNLIVLEFGDSAIVDANKVKDLLSRFV